jgi:hypothetical protein
MYSVQLTVSDDDGGSDTKRASGKVVVVDPNAGWITGGGWINSPAESYAAAPSVAGKLTFNVLARYEGDTPVGSVDFKLSTAKLDFCSRSVAWLMVSGGSATLEGLGTLNGAGDYGFSLTVSDGNVDAARIRVWKRSSGAVVFDSQPGTPVDADALTRLGGGSVQIHSY